MSENKRRNICRKVRNVDGKRIKKNCGRVEERKGGGKRRVRQKKVKVVEGE